MIVYHGTNTKFDKFDTSNIGINTGVGNAIFFTDSETVANSYGMYVTKWNIQPKSAITVDFSGRSVCYMFDNSHTPSQLVELIKDLNEQMKSNSYLSVAGFEPTEDLEFETEDGDIEIETVRLPDDYTQDLIYDELERLGFDRYDNAIDCIIMKNIKDSFDIGGEVSTNYAVLDVSIISNRINEQLAYRGDKEVFDTFDKSKLQDTRYGYGFYFTHDKNYANDYGTVRTFNIPDDDYLIDDENSFRYQPKYIQDCLDKIIEELPDEQADGLIEIIDRTYCNTGRYIYNYFTKIFGYTEASNYLVKHGIKGIYSFKGNCIVVFDAKDIKLNESIEVNGKYQLKTIQGLEEIGGNNSKDFYVVKAKSPDGTVAIEQEDTKEVFLVNQQDLIDPEKPNDTVSNLKIFKGDK